MRVAENLAYSFLAMLGLSLSGCSLLFTAPTPLRSIEYPARATRGSCLFVLLPGLGDTAEAFEKNGFIEDIQKQRPAVDIRATHTSIGYYLKGTFEDRFAEDVIEPAKRRGYKEIWLIGPSLGGFGSLFYSRLRPGDVTGILAIAPFLGEKPILTEIQAAGGLKHWKAPPPVEKPNRNNYQRELWRWLQAVTQGHEPSPLIFMGYGSADDLSTADRLLARELPPSRVFVTSGGHDWPPWRVILNRFLASPDFSGHCASPEEELLSFAPAADASPKTKQRE